MALLTNFGVYSITITRVVAENKVETIILNPLDLNSDARQLLGEKASDYTCRYICSVADKGNISWL